MGGSRQDDAGLQIAMLYHLHQNMLDTLLTPFRSWAVAPPLSPFMFTECLLRTRNYTSCERDQMKNKELALQLN